jgi:hypothetical protein
MTAPPRWAAVATAVSALAVGLPAAAEAATLPSLPTTPVLPASGTTAGSPSSGTTPGVPGVSTCSVSPSSTTTPSTPPPTNSVVPCIEAAGNVYIFYVITVTTTTTITPISAPIITANGAITWITGLPAGTGVGGGPGSTGSVQSAGTAFSGWTKCTAKSNSTVTRSFKVSCPKLPAGPKSGRRLKVMCEVPATATVHARRFEVTKKIRQRARKRPHHYVVYCRSA